MIDISPIRLLGNWNEGWALDRRFRANILAMTLLDIRTIIQHVVKLANKKRCCTRRKRI